MKDSIPIFQLCVKLILVIGFCQLHSDLMGGMGTDTCVLTTGLPLGIEEQSKTNKELIMITDLLGRATHPVPNRVLFYIYDDGSVEKKIRLER